MNDALSHNLFIFYLLIPLIFYLLMRLMTKLEILGEVAN